MLTFVIGDVHGMFEPLVRAGEWIKDKSASIDEHRVIMLGDYVDRGPASREVVNYIQAQTEWIKLRGNHDQFMFVNVPRGDFAWDHGGVATAKSYFCWNDGDYASVTTGNREIYKADARWLGTLPTMYEDEWRIYVHAGLHPSLGRDTDDMDRMWIRDEFLRCSTDFGKLVVHGHTPFNEPQVRENRFGIDTGCVFGKSYPGEYGFLSLAVWDGPKFIGVRMFHHLDPSLDRNWPDRGVCDPAFVKPKWMESDYGKEA